MTYIPEEFKAIYQSRENPLLPKQEKEDSQHNHTRNIMSITAMYPGVKGKNKIRMNG